MPRTRLALVAASVLAVVQSTVAQTPDEIVAQLCPAGVPDSLLLIAGVVRDAASGEPVANARVRI